MFSERTDWPEGTNPLTQKLHALQSAGTPVLDLTVSNPTRCKFKYLDTGLLNALQTPENLLYHPEPHGLLPAREAICLYYKKRGIELIPEQIFITANTSEAYTFLFRLLLHHEPLLAPRPSYPLLDYLAQINDIPLLSYPVKFDGKWRNALESTGSQGAKTVLVVNPNNPTGHYVTPQDFKTLDQFKIPVISDEVFWDFDLESGISKKSFAARTEGLTFTLNGISKILGLPQMKLSWIVVSGPDAIRKEAIRKLEIISDTYLSASTPIQHALSAWLSREAEIQKEIRARCTANYQFLKDAAGTEKLKVLPCEGGWNALLQMPGDLSDEEWALLLLERDHVLVHPGYLYDFQENLLSLSLLIPEAIFQSGIEKIIKRADSI